MKSTASRRTFFGALGAAASLAAVAVARKPVAPPAPAPIASATPAAKDGDQQSEHVNYGCESGASRNYEPWRDIEHAEKILKARSQLEDEDAMKRVERKGFNSKREMDIMDALNEVKLMNKRKQKVNYDELLLQTLTRHD